MQASFSIAAGQVISILHARGISRAILRSGARLQNGQELYCTPIKRLDSLINADKTG
jgi:hypothetical protein